MTTKDKADLILKKAKNSGADADLIIDSGQSLSLKANAGELEEHKVTSSQVYGVRVIKDSRVGIAYSEADDEQSLLSIVDQALANAEFADPEEHERILDNTQTLRTDDSLLCPDDDTSIDDKIALALQLEEQLLAKDKIKSVPYNGISGGLHERQVYSTAGLDAFSRARTFVAYAFALAEDGEKNAMCGFGQASRTNDIDSSVIIDTAYKKCMDALEGVPVPTKHYDIIFDEETRSDLFSVFAMALSGKSAKDGINPWREKVGKQVAAPLLQLYDNPLLTDGLSYCRFDAEGTATKKTPIVTDGVLQTLLHNSMTANHFGVATTGHASRGARSTLGVSFHQLEIAAGTTSKSELESGEYLLITDLEGMHSGANAVSGDFSLGASGYLCKDGVVQQPVRQVTVAGNFYKMLNQIVAIGDKQEWTWAKSTLTPAIRFADVAVSGE